MPARICDDDADLCALLTSVNAQLLEPRKFAIGESARVFRIPPIFLMEYGRTDLQAQRP